MKDKLIGAGIIALLALVAGGALYVGSNGIGGSDNSAAKAKTEYTETQACAALRADIEKKVTGVVIVSGKCVRANKDFSAKSDSGNNFIGAVGVASADGTQTECDGVAFTAAPGKAVSVLDVQKQDASACA